MRIWMLLLAWWTLPALAGVQEETYTDPDTHRSSKYSIQWPSQAAGVLVFFHGSGGGPDYAANMPALIQAAAPYHLAALAIQAPNAARSWADLRPSLPLKHVPYVTSLLDHVVYAAHPDLKRTVFVGFSAGSTFLSGDFLPDLVAKYSGGVILLCGGAAPLARTAINMGPLSEATKEAFKFYFYIQTGDFLYKQTNDGLRYWQMRGMALTGERATGSGHCAFDFAQALNRGLAAVLGPPS